MVKKLSKVQWSIFFRYQKNRVCKIACLDRLDQNISVDVHSFALFSLLYDAPYFMHNASNPI